MSLAFLLLLLGGTQDVDDEAVLVQLRKRVTLAGHELDQKTIALGLARDGGAPAEAIAAAERDQLVAAGAYQRAVTAEIAYSLEVLPPARRRALIAERVRASDERSARIRSAAIDMVAAGERNGNAKHVRRQVEGSVRLARIENEVLKAAERRMSGSPDADQDRLSELLDRGTSDLRFQRWRDMKEYRAEEWILELEHKADLDEYRRLARSTNPVDPRTGRPVPEPVRELVRRDLDQALERKLRERGREGLHAWLYGDRRRAEADRLAGELASAENLALDHVTGASTDMRAYFRSLANAIRKTEGEAEAWFSGEYLPAGDRGYKMLLNVDPESWKNAMTSGRNSVAEVRRRIDAMHREADIVVAALSAAADRDPEALEPGQRELLRRYGYLEGGIAGGERYVIPADGAGRVTRVDDLPGGSWLRALTLKNVGVTVTSVVLPEIGAARLAAVAARVGAAERTVTAVRAVTGFAGGVAHDAALNYLESGKTDLAKIGAEALLLQGVMGKANDAVNAASSKMASLFKDPARRRQAETFVAGSLGLASDASLQTAFQYAFNPAKPITYEDFLSNLVSAAMSRGVSKAHEDSRDAAKPGWLRDLLRDPAMRPLVDREAAFRKTRLEAYDRFLKATRNWDPLSMAPLNLFAALRRGDLAWEDLKLVHAEHPERLHATMTRIAELRSRYYARFVPAGQEAARRELEVDTARKIAEATARFPEGPGREHALREIEQNRLAALHEINQVSVTPGSGGPTSDIDRSHPSPRVRDHVARLGNDALRMHDTSGEARTSARSFDVNEYYKVMRAIEGPLRDRAVYDDLPVDTSTPGAWLRHRDVVDANAHAAAMMHMTEAQRDLYKANQLHGLQSGARDLEIRKLALADRSLREGRQRLEAKISELCQTRGYAPDDPSVETLARDALYGESARRLADLERTMALEPRGSARWREAASAFERELNTASREGIEAYSTSAGIDLIVNTLQRKRADGTKPSPAELMADRNLSLGGELAGRYDAGHIDTMIRDQTMMMMEHVNAYHLGHESAYAAGRALSKYVERTLLGLKIKGEDILRPGPPPHPLKALWETSQALAARKDDPAALRGTLSRLAGPGGTADDGMRKLLSMMEGLPGMNGMTDPRLVAEFRSPGVRSDRALMALRHVREREKEALRRTGGQGEVLNFIRDEMTAVRAELREVKAERAERKRLSETYRREDWVLAKTLEDELALFRFRKSRLPRGGDATVLDREIARREDRLAALRDGFAAAGGKASYVPDDIDALLQHREESLRRRAGELRTELEGEMNRAEEREATESNPADLVGGPIVPPIESRFEKSSDGWTVRGGRVPGERAAYQAVGTDGRRYASAETPRVLQGGPVDLILCFDLTGSMKEEIESVRLSAIRLVDDLGARSRDVRLGLVGFRAVEDGRNAFDVHDLSGDLRGQFAKMNAWQARGGSSSGPAEDQLMAVRRALAMKGRAFDGLDRVPRIIVVISDAPARDPDADKNTIETVAREVRAAGARVYSMVVGDSKDARDQAARFARATGGESSANLSAEQLSRALTGMLDVAFARADPRYWHAPPYFLGDRRAFFRRTLEYEIHGEGREGTFDADDVVLRGGGRTIVLRGRIRPGNGWSRVCVRLDATARWISGDSGKPAPDEEILAVLSNLEGLDLRGQHDAADRAPGLDDVVFGGLAEPTDAGVTDEGADAIDRLERWMSMVDQRERQILEAYTGPPGHRRLEAEFVAAKVQDPILHSGLHAGRLDAVARKVAVKACGATRDGIARAVAAVRKSGHATPEFLNAVKQGGMNWSRVSAALQAELQKLSAGLASVALAEGQARDPRLTPAQREVAIGRRAAAWHAAEDRVRALEAVEGPAPVPQPSR